MKNFRMRFRRFKATGILAALLGAVVFFCGACAMTAAEKGGESSVAQVASPQAPVVFPVFTGEKIRVAVLPMGLSEQAAKRYPHLLQASVGMGVHNMLTDSLYRAGRYRFVEVQESVIKEALHQQWLAASGAMDENSAVQMGKMLGAQKALYGEVYDYSEGKTEKVKGLKVDTIMNIRVGVQIRLVDLETLEYVPATGLGTGADWGQACQRALDAAVLQMVSR